MKIKTIIASMLLLCGIAATAHGQEIAPSNVTNVDAVFEDGKLTVSWSAAADASDIAQYRIYYSRTSIMENNGDYDDFEQTADNSTTYTFSYVPPYPEIFVSVLAVNENGTESEAFEDEARVVIAASESSSSSSDITSSLSSPSSSVSSGHNDRFTLISAVSSANTGVTLTFSKTLAADQNLPLEDVIILDGSGTRLNIQAIQIAGNTMRLKTDKQEPERRYIVAKFGNAKDTSGNMAITLKQIDFRGFMEKDGPITDQTPPENPTNLRLVPRRNGKGTFDVFSFWKGSPDSAGDIDGYEVSVAHGGSAYVHDASVPKNAREQKHEDLKPGSTFGVKIQSKDASGNTSSGISRVIRLPQSGLGILGITALSLGLAGRSLKKRKRV